MAKDKLADGTTYACSAEDNLLGIADWKMLNESEQEGIIRAEDYILDLSTETPISTQLVRDIHKIAFSHLYDWAGKFRQEKVIVGSHTPPIFTQIPVDMEMFMGNLNYRIQNQSTFEELVECLTLSHHGLLYIHPFKNGNGRTARMFTNFIALKNGYQNIEIYSAKGDARDNYLFAVSNADKGNFDPMNQIIKAGLKSL